MWPWGRANVENVAKLRSSASSLEDDGLAAHREVAATPLATSEPPSDSTHEIRGPQINREYWRQQREDYGRTTYTNITSYDHSRQHLGSVTLINSGSGVVYFGQ